MAVLHGLVHSTKRRLRLRLRLRLWLRLWLWLWLWLWLVWHSRCHVIVSWQESDGERACRVFT
eukprot:COSAG06_NODE_16457_length_1000_cov_1.860155_1_plen_62_part_10